MVFHAVVRAKLELCEGKRPPALGVWDPQPFKNKSKNPQMFLGCMRPGWATLVLLGLNNGSPASGGTWILAYV